MKRTAARRSTAILAMAGAFALVLTGCASGGSTGSSTASVPGATAAQNASLNKLYKSAIDAKKTQVVIYGPSPSTSDPLYAQFNKSFPSIKIVSQDESDSTTLSKLKVEATSGHRQADLYMGGAQAVAVAAANPQLCVKPTISTVAPSQVTYQGSMLAYGLKYFGIVYNTNMVKKADVPTSWQALLASKWKGKIEMSDPTVLGGTQFMFADMLLPAAKDQFGESYLTKLAAQDPTYSENEPNVPSDVAAGRFPIGVGVYVGYYSTEKAKGVPINFVFPFTQGGNFTVPVGACQVKDAPDAAASSLFLDWLYTSNGQKALANYDHSYGTLPNAPGPNGAPPLASLKVLPTLGNNIPAYEPYFQTVISIFKK